MKRKRRGLGGFMLTDSELSSHDLVFRYKNNGFIHVYKNRYKDLTQEVSVKDLNDLRKKNPNRSELIICDDKMISKIFKVLPCKRLP